MSESSRFANGFEASTHLRTARFKPRSTRCVIASRAIRSPAGKTVRFLSTTAAGLVLPPVGIALSGLDTFLTEKIVPEPGPTAFLGQLYSSVFPTAA
jgi:hypothetical protein